MTSLSGYFARWFVGSVGCGASAFLLVKSWVVVQGGHCAVIWDFKDGIKLDSVKTEGSFLLVPWAQRPFFFDIRTTPKQINTETGSKDLQNVKLSLRVLYRPNPAHLPELFKEYGLDYAERTLPSLGNEVLKAVVAQYDAGELITQREVVSREIREVLTDKSKAFHILLDDVSITHLGFSDEFSRAIEYKQVAQQDAERARFIVEKTEQEAKAAVIRAEGESEAARLINDATKRFGPALIELRRLEASREIAEALGKSKNITFLPNQANILLGTQR